MKIKFLLRTLNLSGHPEYLQNGFYGLNFSHGTTYPFKLQFFDSKEEAVNWLRANPQNKFIEIVEVCDPYDNCE